MTLADRIRTHLAEYGSNTKAGIAAELGVSYRAVQSAMQSLVKQGHCIGTPSERVGRYPAASWFSLSNDASVPVSRFVNSGSASNDIWRVWT